MRDCPRESCVRTCTHDIIIAINFSIDNLLSMILALLIKMKVLLYLFWFGAFHTSLCAGGQPLDIDQDLLDAIRQVESGGDDCAIGDEHLQNKAYGLYQIRMPYYMDALEFNPDLGGNFVNVWGQGSKEYSEGVVESYMGRYATEGRLGHVPTNEDIARIHNGGPNGHNNPRTVPYWNLVKDALANPNPQRSVANCNLTCNQNECCGSTTCNCLDSSLMVLPCDSLSDGAVRDSIKSILLLSLAAIAITVVMVY